MNEGNNELIQERIRNLREETDFISTIFDTLIGYAIIAADFDGTIIAYNEGARQIYGYAPEEVIGKQNFERFFPEDFVESKKLQQIIADLIAKGGFSCDVDKVRKNGERFPARILLALTRDKKGKMVGFIEIVADLTERKRIEEERAQAQADAERMADAERIADAERMANAERIELLEKELLSLEQIHSSPQTGITSHLFGLAPLHEAQPDIFDELVEMYADLIEHAMTQRMYKVNKRVSEDLYSLAERMCLLNAGARDVVNVHSAAMKRKITGVNSKKAQAYAEEGRLMSLELMGNLVTFYRNNSLGVRRNVSNKCIKARV